MDVLDEFIEEGREQGLKEGRREGERTGERKGRARTLLELLAKRFGAVPAKTKAQILAADETTLSRWSLRVLDASTLAEIFDETTPARPAKKTKKPAAPAKRVTTSTRSRAAR